MKYSTDTWIGPLIKMTARNMTNIHDQKLAKYGLTASQVGVLSQLWKKDGQTQKELLEKLKIRPASLTGIIDGMVDKGLVRRVTDQIDARVKRVLLTEKGREKEADSLVAVLEMEQLLRKGFTDEEIAIISLWLKRLLKNVEEY